MTPLFDEHGNFTRIPTQAELLVMLDELEEQVGDGRGTRGAGVPTDVIRVPTKLLVASDGWSMRHFEAALNGQTSIPVGFFDKGLPRWWSRFKGLKAMLQK